MNTDPFAPTEQAAALVDALRTAAADHDGFPDLGSHDVSLRVHLWDTAGLSGYVHHTVGHSAPNPESDETKPRVERKEIRYDESSDALVYEHYDNAFVPDPRGEGDIGVKDTHEQELLVEDVLSAID